jgi:peptidoglycan/xylan/chitin deacetylase (PgdA/CDA1 family)
VRDRYLLLTFDLEEFDWPRERGQSIDDEVQLQVTCAGLDRLRPFLEKQAVRATFFTTAAFAAARPAVVRELAAQGHEIAAHGLAHTDDYLAMELAEELKALTAARLQLEAITGRSVAGFRAPRLQVGRLQAIRDAGYLYGANVHPTWVPGRYRALNAPRRPWREAGLVRVPISVTPWVHWPLSFFWFRLAGVRLATWGARLALAETGYLHLYFHPWEAMRLTEYGIPRWLAVRSGPRFVDMLGDFLEALGPLESVTVGEYVKRTAGELDRHA